MQEERRATNRWCINAPCEVKFTGDERLAGCRIRDINLKGLQITTPIRMPRDAFLNITLICQESCLLDVEVWVVWERILAGEHIYGFYFTRMADGDRAKIYKFLCESYPKVMVQCWWKGVTEEEKGEETMEDNRIFERIPANFPLRFLEPGTGQEGQGETQDISAKGMGIFSRSPFAPRTALELWVEYPGQGEPHYARGEVIWSQMVGPDKFRVGVSLEKADLMGLSRFLRT